MANTNKNSLASYQAGKNFVLSAVECKRDLEEVFSELLRGEFGENLWAYAGGISVLTPAIGQLADAGLLPSSESSDRTSFKRAAQTLRLDKEQQAKVVIGCTVGNDTSMDPLTLVETMLDALRPYGARLETHPEGWVQLAAE